MKLVQFDATGLNHIETITIPFNEHLNFITGVNGSGKTSVLSAIVSLLVPNLEALADLKFKNIAITFEINNENQKISAEKSLDGEICIRSNRTSKVFRYRAYDYDDSFPSADENRAKYYQGLIEQSHESPVMRQIMDVPTPMYLGLDRRYRGSWRPNYRWAPRPKRRRKSNIFGSSISDSLGQAVMLAEEKFQESEIKTAHLRSEFVRDLLLELLDFPSIDGFGGVEAPTSADRKLVEQARKAILQFPKVEGISADDIRSRIEPTLLRIAKALGNIPQDLDLSKINPSESKMRDVIPHLLSWSSYKPALNQINKISALVTIYNDRTKESKIEINRYTALVEKFIGETSKTIGFDTRGSLQISHRGSYFPVFELSSGEAQIFVLLTHLAFNSDAQEAGVFVIDEPELSLHLLWQEILVESLMKANSSLQYILATHSPSIILDDINYPFIPLTHVEHNAISGAWKRNRLLHRLNFRSASFSLASRPMMPVSITSWPFALAGRALSARHAARKAAIIN